MLLGNVPVDDVGAGVFQGEVRPEHEPRAANAAELGMEEEHILKRPLDALVVEVFGEEEDRVPDETALGPCRVDFQAARFSNPEIPLSLWCEVFLGKRAYFGVMDFREGLGIIPDFGEGLFLKEERGALDSPRRKEIRQGVRNLLPQTRFYLS